MPRSSLRDVLEINIPWDEDLDTRSSALQVDLEAHGPSRTFFLVEGYRLAAEHLIARCLEQPETSHKLIYPILFCYRHFVELSLKWILEKYGYFGDVQPIYSCHDLISLWCACKRICTELSVSAENVQAVERHLLGLSSLDPNSFVFRYATDKKGDFIKLKLDEIDLRKLSETIEKFDAFCYALGIDAYTREMDFLLEARIPFDKLRLQHQSQGPAYKGATDSFHLREIAAALAGFIFSPLRVRA